METTTDRILVAIELIKAEARAQGMVGDTKARGEFLAERHGPVVDRELVDIRDQASRILEQHGGVGVAMLLGTLMKALTTDVTSRAQVAKCPTGTLMASIIDKQIAEVMPAMMLLTKLLIGFESHSRSCGNKEDPA